MALYILHKTFEGEPVGIHSDTESFYVPGHAAMEKKGTGFVDSWRGSNPWSEAVEILEDRVSHQDWWEGRESDLPMQAALDEARSNFVAQQNDQ